MSVSDVTRRFLNCLDKLLEEGKVKSKRQFALALGYHPQGLSEMGAGRRDVPIELIEKAVVTFWFNPAYLFTGAGSFFSNPEGTDQFGVQQLTIMADENGRERIVHVPCPAQAGYGKSLNDPVFFQELPSYNLPDPQFTAGTYRSFEISGKSMEPSFYQNDIVIAAYVEPKYWEQAIKNNHIYILVTQEEVIIKRIINHIKTDKIVECLSDNPEFDAYTLRIFDILEIWKVRVKLTAQLDQAPSGLNALDISKQLKAHQKMLENLQEQFIKTPLG